jgi:hypothetical protein
MGREQSRPALYRMKGKQMVELWFAVHRESYTLKCPDVHNARLVYDTLVKGGATMLCVRP